MKEIKRGDIFYAELSEGIGSEQEGIRPVLIVQNDTGNAYSPTVIVVPITSAVKSHLPTHIVIGKESGLNKKSTLLTEQIQTIDKKRIYGFVGKIGKDKLVKINRALMISLGVNRNG